MPRAAGNAGRSKQATMHKNAVNCCSNHDARRAIHDVATRHAHLSSFIQKHAKQKLQELDTITILHWSKADCRQAQEEPVGHVQRHKSASCLGIRLHHNWTDSAIWQTYNLPMHACFCAGHDRSDASCENWVCSQKPGSQRSALPAARTDPAVAQAQIACKCRAMSGML